MAKQPQCAAISPMQIVGVKKERLTFGNIRKDQGHRIKKQQSFFMSSQAGTFRKWTKSSLYFGCELRNLGCVLAQNIAHFVVIFLIAYPATKRFNKGNIRSSRLVLI